MLIVGRVTWARVSERTCIDWINYGNKVRAVAAFRVDWPNATGCSVEIPPGASCPLSIFTKAPQLSVQDLNVTLYWDLAGRKGSGTCSLGSLFFNPPGVGMLGVRTVTCKTNWMSHPTGLYTAAVSASFRTGTQVRFLPKTDYTGLSFR